MSHWRKFSSNVLEDTNKEILARALSQMGLIYDDTIKKISNPWGREQVSAGLIKNDKPLALGFNFNQETRDGEKHEVVQLTGDFYGTGLNESEFIDKLAQTYQTIFIQDKMDELGWNIDEETMKTTENGEIVMEFTQFA